MPSPGRPKKAADPNATRKRARSRKPGDRPPPTRVIPHNCHFSAETLDVIERHAALTKSGGISGMVRTVIEVYLADAVDFGSPQYCDLTPVVRPKERYPGQFERLRLA